MTDQEAEALLDRAEAELQAGRVVTDPSAVAAAIERLRPWWGYMAVVNKLREMNA